MQVEKEAGVLVVYSTPRGETPIKSNSIKAHLAYFQQFEEEVELTC